MILVLCFRLAGSIHWYLYAYAPTNILTRYLRSPDGQKWAFPISAALTAGYLASTAGLTTILESGGPGWLNLVTLVWAWNAMKFGLMGVLSLPMSFRAALRDRRAQRESRGMLGSSS